MKEKILMVLCALFGLGMIIFGANKLIPFLPMPEMSAEMKQIFGAFGTIKWLMPLVGTFEIIGGLLVAIPKTRALGAIVILPIIVGIFFHNLTFFTTSGLITTLFFALIDFWVIIENKNKYMPMIQ